MVSKLPMAGCGSGVAPPNSCDSEVTCAMIARGHLQGKDEEPQADAEGQTDQNLDRSRAQDARASGDHVGATAGATMAVKARASTSRTRCGTDLLAKGRHQRQGRADPQEDQNRRAEPVLPDARQRLPVGRKDRSRRHHADQSGPRLHPDFFIGQDRRRQPLGPHHGAQETPPQGRGDQRRERSRPRPICSDDRPWHWPVC